MHPAHVLPLLALVACVPQLSAQWTPKNSDTLRPVTRRARIVREDDLATLEKAGARTIGQIDMAGNFDIGPSEMQVRAACESARHGGSHYFVKADQRGKKPTQTVTVMRLDDDEWERLPVSLRPKVGTPEECE